MFPPSLSGEGGISFLLGYQCRQILIEINVFLFSPVRFAFVGITPEGEGSTWEKSWPRDTSFNSCECKSAGGPAGGSLSLVFCVSV